MKPNTLHQVCGYILYAATVFFLSCTNSMASDIPLKSILNAVTQAELEPDYRFSYGPHASQFGDLRLPKKAGSHPVIILVHGGCWQSRYNLHLMDALAERLTELGFATWNIEFRRQGRIKGSWGTSFHDVMLATAYINNLGTRYALDTNNVVMLGHSSGGHLALWLAGQASYFERKPIVVDTALKIKGVVALAPLTDLVDLYSTPTLVCHKQLGEFVGVSPAENMDLYRLISPAHMKKILIPQIVISGNKDFIVPQSSIERYIRTAAKRGDKIQHEKIENASHFDLILSQAETFDVIQKAVSTLIDQHDGE